MLIFGLDPMLVIVLVGFLVIAVFLVGVAVFLKAVASYLNVIANNTEKTANNTGKTSKHSKGTKLEIRQITSGRLPVVHPITEPVNSVTSESRRDSVSIESAR